MHDQKGAGQMEFIYNWILKLSFFAVLGSMILQMLPDHGFQKYVRFVLGLILTAMLHLKKFIITVYIRFRSVNWKKKVRKFRKRFSG